MDSGLKRGEEGRIPIPYLCHGQLLSDKTKGKTHAHGSCPLKSQFTAMAVMILFSATYVISLPLLPTSYDSFGIRQWFSCFVEEFRILKGQLFHPRPKEG